MNKFALLAMVGLGISSVRAEEPKPTVARVALDAIHKDWLKARRVYIDAYDVAKTAEQRKDLAKLEPDMSEFANRFWKLAEAHPNTSEELQAICWAGMFAPETEAGKKAKKLLIGKRIAQSTPTELIRIYDTLRSGAFMSLDTGPIMPSLLELAKASPKEASTGRLLGWICAAEVGYGTEKPTLLFQEAADLILEKYADDPGISHFCEVLGHLRAPKWAGEFEKHIDAITKNNRDILVVLTSRYALCEVTMSKGVDYQPDAIKLFKQYVVDIEKGLILKRNENRSCESLAENLVYMAKRQLRQLESCSPGHAAPDFEGDDLDGKKLKLKDYRGKVVLLVFWGSWCGPCLNDVPHEKELVEKFKDRPFEIIGINFDDDLKEANLAVKTHAITWRSLADKKACVVKASENYVYSALPTVYVIDHEGIIRENKLRGKDLDEPLEKLVVEAEKANKEKKK